MKNNVSAIFLKSFTTNPLLFVAHQLNRPERSEYESVAWLDRVIKY